MQKRTTIAILAAGLLAGSSLKVHAFTPKNDCEREFLAGCINEIPVQPGDCDGIEPGVKSIKSGLTDQERCLRGQMPRYGPRGQRVLSCLNGGKYVCE